MVAYSYFICSGLGVRVRQHLSKKLQGGAGRTHERTILKTFTTTEDRVVRLGEAFAILGIPPRTGHHWIQKNILPKPLALGPRARGYRLSTLNAHLASKVATAAHPAIALVTAMFSKDGVGKLDGATQATFEREVMDYLHTRAQIDGVLPAKEKAT